MRPNNASFRLVDISKRLHELPELFHPLYKRWSNTWIAHSFSRILKKGKATGQTKKPGDPPTRQGQDANTRTKEGGTVQQPDNKPAEQGPDASQCTDKGSKTEPKDTGIILQENNKKKP
jgi:hypothetical protein